MGQEQQGTLRLKRQGKTLLFQVSQRATMPQGTLFRRFVEGCLETRPLAVLLDLRHCSYMDSTFLGTLILLKHEVEGRGGRFMLVCPSPSCSQTIQQMGLQRLLKTVTADEPSPDGWIELKDGLAENGELDRQVAEAHEELARLPGPAGEQFRNVARLMDEDLAKRDDQRL